MTESESAARHGRRVYHQAYARLRREGRSRRAAKAIAGRLGREACRVHAVGCQDRLSRGGVGHPSRRTCPLRSGAPRELNPGSPGLTGMTDNTELTVSCAPWGGSHAEHRVRVDFDLAEGPIVRVWDPIANHYSRQHVLTAAAEAQIVADAGAR